jgi:predicted dehydrogenase
VAGLCDIDTARLDASVAKIGGGVKGGTDAAKLAKEIKPDVFCFCTQPGTRLPLVRKGVAAGVKLICLEKPLATSLAEGKQMLELCQAAGVKMTLSHQIKYGEHFRKVAEIVESGALGRIHTIYGTATGWLLHMATHVVDFIRTYNGMQPAEWVVGQAIGREKLTDNHPSPDYVMGTVQFANGVRGIMEIGYLAPDIPEVEYWWHKGMVGVYGTTGYAEAVIGGGWRAATKDGFASGPGCWDAQLDQPPYIQEIADWLDHPARGHSCSGESAYQNLEIVMGMLRSAVARQQVTFPLVPDVGETELQMLDRVLPR